jgi:hypothetical protein
MRHRARVQRISSYSRGETGEKFHGESAAPAVFQFPGAARTGFSVEHDGEIRLTPIEDGSHKNQSLETECVAMDIEEKIGRLNALRGSGKDIEMTVESFIKMTHDETEI